MNAEIIAVGSELLTPQRIDTDSLYLTEQLNGMGIEVVGKSVIGDDRDRLAESVKSALARSEIVITTGGLGPTEDDVTRDAVAAALGRELRFRQEICDSIEARFAGMGRKMAEINRRQAWVIDGAEAMDNDHGTAPGLWIEPDDDRVLMLLPGPPRELQPMFSNACRPRLEALIPALAIRSLHFRVTGMPESDLDQLIAPVYTKYDNPVTTVLASPGDIQIHLRARCEQASEAEALLAEVGSRIEALLGDRIYSRNGDPLEQVVGNLLRQRSATLAVAESCTSGMLAERLTTPAGSSDYFLGGFLVYSAALKTQLLDVDEALIAEHSVVSREVAEAMAASARHKTGADYVLSITGEAGPDSATEHPPGTAFIGLAAPDQVLAQRHRFFGDRHRVRLLAVQTAMNLLRKELLAG